MRLFLVLALLSFAVAAVAQQKRQAQPAVPVRLGEEAPAGFDDKSNGLIDDATHGDDKKAFDEVETIEEGLWCPVLLRILDRHLGNSFDDAEVEKFERPRKQQH